MPMTFSCRERVSVKWNPTCTGGVPFDAYVISECYERKSVIITTNLESARWNDIFADTKITAAPLDRIIHHSHLLDFTGRESWRLKDALTMERQTKKAKKGAAK